MKNMFGFVVGAVSVLFGIRYLKLDSDKLRHDFNDLKDQIMGEDPKPSVIITEDLSSPDPDKNNENGC